MAWAEDENNEIEVVRFVHPPDRYYYRAIFQMGGHFIMFILLYGGGRTRYANPRSEKTANPFGIRSDCEIIHFQCE